MERNYGYNKGNSYLSNYLSRKSRTSKSMQQVNRKTAEKVYIQFIVSAVICLTVIVVSNFNISIINRLIGGVKWVVSTDYDFKTAVYSFRNNVMPVIDDRFKGISDGVGGILENNEESGTPVANKTVMIMPVSGEVTSDFGEREDPITGQKAQHLGIDISGEKGTPIKCPMDGVVIKIEENKTLGRSVRIRHSGGLETVYGHCSEILVDENQKVKQGDYIAKVGDTGIVTAPHLHFEVMKDGEIIDPLNVLEGIKQPK